MTTVKELGTSASMTWCKGCGNFVILAAMKKVLVELEKTGLDLSKVVMVSGIGCHAKIVDYINVNSFYSIHGRVPSTIAGIKLADPDLLLIGHAGDGDAYGEGIAHLVFSAKRNTDSTLIVHNNRTYGLTTGQFTPTSPLGFKGRSTPKGSPEEPLNPLEFMISSGATFVARGYSGRVKHLEKIFQSALTHSGFSFVDVLEPCRTFFDNQTYYDERVYELANENHDPSCRDEALDKSLEWCYGQGERIPLGVFYQVEKPTYEARVLQGKTTRSKDRRTISQVLDEHH